MAQAHAAVNLVAELAPKQSPKFQSLVPSQSLLLDGCLIHSFPITPILEMRKVRLRLNNLIRSDRS